MTVKRDIRLLICDQQSTCWDEVRDNALGAECVFLALPAAF
jgi:hypothetical protein